jgi:hypothetical protein
LHIKNLLAFLKLLRANTFSGNKKCRAPQGELPANQYKETPVKPDTAMVYGTYTG